jgi:hypothetical protein
VGVLENPVEHGVGNGGVAQSLGKEGLVPHRHRQLGRDDGAAEQGPVLDDLEQVGSLIGIDPRPGPSWP